MDTTLANALAKKDSIRQSKLTIYEPVEVGSANWYTGNELEAILNHELVGKSYSGLAIRTRSKVAKTDVCNVLGYPVPLSFQKTQPRFPSQNLDTYVQKSNNLQIWNEELDPERRYVLISTDTNDLIKKVKVVNGADLAILDTTGTLTQKYQARLTKGDNDVELISTSDTQILSPIVSTVEVDLTKSSPIGDPEDGKLLSINEIFSRISTLKGASFNNAGITQERNRGGDLHKLVLKALGYSSYLDNGQFPDVKHQLLEVKLQTSPTIDLGLVCPDSESLLDIPNIREGVKVRHQDVRYALFSAEIIGDQVVIANVYLTTGEDFFSRFPKFGGKVLNKKIQIPLPTNFFY